jgi:hypothetical protein
MENVPYVGFATYRRVTVKIRLYFKELMFMKCFIKKKKKKGIVTIMNLASINCIPIRKK